MGNNILTIKSNFATLSAINKTMASGIYGACHRNLAHEKISNRDLLNYLLWSTDWYNTQKIGDLFGFCYSSARRQIAAPR